MQQPSVGRPTKPFTLEPPFFSRVSVRKTAELVAKWQSRLSSALASLAFRITRGVLIVCYHARCTDEGEAKAVLGIVLINFTFRCLSWAMSYLIKEVFIRVLVSSHGYMEYAWYSYMAKQLA